MIQSDSPMVADSAALLLIGNELLTGKIQEANLVPLAQLLRVLGVSLVRCSVVPDDVETIATELQRLRQVADVVFTSGGIGPTHDDVTIEAVARAFGVAVVTPPHLALRLRDVYGESCNDTHLRMAATPEGAVLLGDSERSWPLVRMENVWILPGIPELFRAKLDVVRAHLRGRKSYYSAWVKLLWEEVQLKQTLDAVVVEYPEVDVGSYPRWFSSEYKTKVTFDGQSHELVVSALQSLLARLPKSAVTEIDMGETP